MINFLKKDLGLKIFCLILAIFFWGYIQYTASSRSVLLSEANFYIPLKVENVDKNLIPLKKSKAISLMVEGNPHVLSNLKPENFKAFVSLDKKKAGKYKVPVNVNLPPDVRAVKIEPSIVDIKLDSITKKFFIVKVRTQGILAPNFILTKIVSTPQKVTISGAKSLISKIKEVRAFCNILNADTDFVQKLKVDFVDKEGKYIEGLKVEPEFIYATVNIQSKIKETAVPILLSLSGSPAPGSCIAKIKIDPSSATIKYRHNIDSPPSFIKTKSISIKGLKDSFTQKISLKIPKGILLVKPKFVNVKITISKQKNQ